MKRILVLLLIGGGLAYWGYGNFGSAPQSRTDKSIASSDTVSISRVTRNPRKYTGATVTVRGRITQSLSVGIGAYVLNDQTGRLLVRTDKAAPTSGQFVTVTGKLDQMVKLGSTQLFVLDEHRFQAGEP